MDRSDLSLRTEALEEARRKRTGLEPTPPEKISKLFSDVLERINVVNEAALSSATRLLRHRSIQNAEGNRKSRQK